MIDGHNAWRPLSAPIVCLIVGGWLFTGTAMAAATPASEWRWRLTGTIVGPSLREALFEQGNATRVVREGRQLDGWTVASVQSDSVTLAADGETMSFSPKGLGAGEADVGARIEPGAQAERSVQAALSEQQRDQQTAETALSDATRQMIFRGKIRHKRR
ncbi:MAG TPA: hypothetical protein VM689_20320 [Aliidongia sp.]|nr:hypothetical protein [Aliidongia sp.]